MRHIRAKNSLKTTHNFVQDPDDPNFNGSVIEPYSAIDEELKYCTEVSDDKFIEN